MCVLFGNYTRFCYGLCELKHNHEPPNLQVNSTAQTSQDIACEQAKKSPTFSTQISSNIKIPIKTCIFSFDHWIFFLFSTMVRPDQQKTAHHWLTGTPFDNPSHPFQTATGTYWLVVKVKRKSSFGALGKWNRCSATEASEQKKTGGHHPVFLFQNEDPEVVECIYLYLFRFTYVYIYVNCTRITVSVLFLDIRTWYVLGSVWGDFSPWKDLGTSKLS